MRVIILIIVLLFSGVTIAQNDTIIVNNNSKFKIGIKGLLERSNRGPNFNQLVYNYGIHGIYKLGNSKSFLETGVFSLNRKFGGYYEVTYRNIQIPVKYRLETKIIYFNIGIYGSYLLAIEADYITTHNKTSSDRKFNVGYIGALGIEKKISKQFSIFIEGWFTDELSSIKKKDRGFFYFDSEYNIEEPNIGIAIGINYKILRK
ncbi:MAG: hypothetical protein COA97_10120 [Flavobacteriales bacterium]|nr:MAG: hypothetical protein COA97_10120 [Flavobacteriales bacterium]